MSERLKESVLKTEVLIGIPGVRIPLHPRGQCSLLRNESYRCLCYRLSLVSLSLSSYRLGKGRVSLSFSDPRSGAWSRDSGVEAGCFSGLSSSTPCSAAGGTSSGDRTINASADERV